MGFLFSCTPYLNFFSGPGGSSKYFFSFSGQTPCKSSSFEEMPFLWDHWTCSLASLARSCYRRGKRCIFFSDRYTLAASRLAGSSSHAGRVRFSLLLYLFSCGLYQHSVNRLDSHTTVSLHLFSISRISAARSRYF